MLLEISEIRKEPFEVKASIKNIKKMHDFQLNLGKIREEAEEKSGGEDLTFEDLASIEVLIDSRTIEEALKFISDILKLSKEEIDEIEEMDRFEFNNLQNKLVLILQGYSEEDIEKIFSEQEVVDPKKEQAQKSK